MRRVAALLLLPLLLASCDDGPAESTPTPTVTATSTSAATDPFEAIAPPTSPGVGGFDGLLANRAYQAARGFLALQLLEVPTVTGKSNDLLVERLQGQVEDLSVGRDLGATPSRAGLDYRPLFPAGATVPSPVGEVTASSYEADEVRGQAGEEGLRVTWKGTVVYPVTLSGTTSDVTYSLTFGYVFSRVPGDPTGLVMQQVVKGTSSAEGVITACLDKGYLYPGEASAPCPL